MKLEAAYDENLKNDNLRHTIIKGAGALDSTGFNYYKHLSPLHNKFQRNFKSVIPQQKREILN